MLIAESDEYPDIPWLNVMNYQPARLSFEIAEVACPSVNKIWKRRDEMQSVQFQHEIVIYRQN